MRASSAWSCLLLVAVSGSRCDNDSKRRGTSESPAAFGAEVGLSFTPGTRIVGVHRESGGDNAVFAKLEVPKTEFEQFWASTHIDRASMRSNERGMLGSDFEFWDPQKARTLATDQVELAGARWMNIGVDESRADVIVVYVLVHGT